MAHHLVTGAAGFIGSKVCELLLRSGEAVVGVDSFSDFYDVRLKEWRARQLVHPRFELRRLDIVERGAVESLFEEFGTFDAVIHLAARPGVRQSVASPWECYRVNLDGTLNLLHALAQGKVGKFVLASTSSVYGERPDGPFHEDHPTDRPLSPYAASKKAAETLCFAYHRLWGLDVTVLRYFTVYGPAGRPDMSPFRFTQWMLEERPIRLYGDGSQTRDFTFVDDIAKGTLLGLKPMGYEVINLGGDHPVAVSELIERIERLTGRRAVVYKEPRPAADVGHTWADIGKAKRLLGWIPETDLETGLSRTVQWHRENRSWLDRIGTGA